MFVIDYLKVDCEGGEYDFLLGQDLSFVRFLAIEMHGDGPKRGELMSHLKKYFEVYHQLDPTTGKPYADGTCYSCWPHASTLQCLYAGEFVARGANEGNITFHPSSFQVTHMKLEGKIEMKDATSHLTQTATKAQLHKPT